MDDRQKPSLVPDFVRKAVQNTVSSILSSEEGIRSIVREVLPKELFGYVKEVIDAAKTEGLRIVSAQTRDFLDRLDIDELAAHMVQNYRIKVRLDLELEPKKQGSDPMATEMGVTVERKEQEPAPASPGSGSRRPRGRRQGSSGTPGTPKG